MHKPFASSPSPSLTPLELKVYRLGMSHPGDLSALASLLDAGTVQPGEVVAVIGKTEGNGGVNDFTRGFFTQSLMALLGSRLGRFPEDLASEIPCILSGGTEGVLSPHYVVFVRHKARVESSPGPAVALGRALSADMQTADIAGWTHVRMVAETVRAAMHDARIERAEDVVFVQVKSPFVTPLRAQAAIATSGFAGRADANRAMALARAAGAMGVALALGHIADDPALESALLSDFDIFCNQASVSCGLEVRANEVVVLGHSPHWHGPLRMTCAPMADALDLGAVVQALAKLGLRATPQLSPDDSARIAAVFVKCEPDRHGVVRGARHTMLGDTDINAQRHIRGAVGGMVAGVLGDTRIFVSGGAEHQGPDGGGLFAVIAEPAH